MKTYQGSCHCGVVRFEADLDLAEGVNKCNCTYCTKARSWFAIVPPEHFRVLAGKNAVRSYRWTPPGKPASYLHHDFCTTCGVRTFGGGGEKPDFYYVAIAALDGVDPDTLAAAPVRVADGLHDRFDQPAPDTRLV
jgi:hypothetical protein